MFFEIKHPRKTEWVSYVITDSSSYVMHIGVCKFSLMTTLPDWPGRYETNGSIYVAQICRDEKLENVVNATIGYCQKQQIAPALVDRFKRLALSADGTGDRHVMCVDTGVIFPTAAAAARAAGVAPSSMCRHLDGTVGYRTIKGQRYKKCITL